MSPPPAATLLCGLRGGRMAIDGEEWAEIAHEHDAGSQRVHPPTVSMSGRGYEYVRCQRGDRDDTVYLHQLDAVADGTDPHCVFSDGTQVQHIVPIPWLNTPENVRVIGTPQIEGRPDWDDKAQERIDSPSVDEVFPHEKAQEPTVEGVPASEHERLEAVNVDGGRSEVSQNLREQMREYRDRDRRGGVDE